MRITAGYIPNIGETKFDKKILKFQDLEVELPLLTLEQLQKVVDTVKRESAEILKSLSVSTVVDIIGYVTEQFLDRSSSYRQQAEKLLPIVTGYDEEVIRLGLTSFLKTFRKHELQRFLVEDLGNPLLLDHFQPRKRWFFKSNWTRTHYPCMGRECSSTAYLEFRIWSASKSRKYRKSFKF